MQTFKEALKCALLALLVVAAAWGIRIEITISADAERFPSQLDARVDAASAAANLQISHLAALVDKQLSVLTGRLDNRTGEALEVAKDIESRIVDPLHDSLANLSVATGELAGELKPGGDAQASIANAAKATGDLDRALVDLPAQLSALNATIATTVKPIGETAQQIDDQAPLFLDCDHNPDCLFNRYQGVSKSIEQFGRSSQGIAADVKREVDQLTRPQTFWGQLKNWLLTLAKIYRGV